MQTLHSIHPLYSLSGFVVGLLVGLTGVGGGSLMTPLLVLLFGIRATTAVGTDLLYACITKSVGTAVHGFSETVDWPIVGKLAAGSVPATALTLVVLSRYQRQLDSSNQSRSCRHACGRGSQTLFLSGQNRNTGLLGAL